jgi:DNA ligase 4
MSDVEDMADDDDGQSQGLGGHVDAALLSRADLVDAEYPNRPRNTAPTLQFRELVCSLFEAMVDLQNRPKVRQSPRLSAPEARRDIINRFIRRWRNDVGPDIYPAFRLIMPDRDKDRPMYGLKEASLGKMLVAVPSHLPHQSAPG